MKKRIILAVLTGCCMAMVACGNEETSDVKTQENTTETTQEESIPSQEESTEVPEETKEDTTEETDTLVVYFSNTGNTQAIAESIAGGLDANLYEIVPEEPYTQADLDYGDDNSRSTLEMNDSSVRPAIEGSVENMDAYETVYIGFPIWWGEAPRILDTFVESYDFADKTVIPFCTSASSGMGSAARGLEELAEGGNWLEGKRFSGNESSDDVMEWVNGL